VNPINKPFFHGPPLFIVDRSLEPNVAKALSLKTEHVARIDFYNLPQTIRHFGHLGRYGVVSITTKFPRLNQSGIYEEISGVQEEYDSRITLPESQIKNMPSISPLIFWNPDIMIDQNGQAQIRYKQSDDLGTFVIEVFAHGPEGLAHALHTYQVVGK
jgi:hypothetical protein